jgi:glycosyltransferase involved in cell wall biosynthesis
LSWFVSDIFGRVLQRQPKTQLVVVGHWPEQLREPFSQLPAVTFAGNVSGPDIAAIYQRSRVAIAPIRFGAGVKVKVITALSYGVPVVSTAVGLAGIDISAEDDEPRDPGELGAIQADDAASFAQAVSWLINAGTAWRTYSDRGEQFVARVYSRAQFVLAWERALESAILERNRRVGETD